MKQAAGTFLVALLLIVASASRVSAWPHGGFHRGPVHRVFPHRVFPRFPSRPFVVGRPWWGNTYWFAPGWGYAYPGPYAYPYDLNYEGFYSPYYAAPVVVAPPQKTYWYYCASADEYYPKVRTCPEAWIKVPSTPE